MPKTTRDWAVRKIEMADGNLSWAITHIAEIVEKYHEPHPEIAGPFLMIIEAIQLIQKRLYNPRILL